MSTRLEITPDRIYVMRCYSERFKLGAKELKACWRRDKRMWQFKRKDRAKLLKLVLACEDEERTQLEKEKKP